MEGDTLIAKAGGNGKSRRGKLNCQKNNCPSVGKGERVDGVGVEGVGAAVGKGGGGEGGGGATTKSKRPQYCTICKNHNQQVLKKRHKCPYSDCQCPLCQLSRRVQCIMCHQQRLWRFRKSMEKNGSSHGGSEVSTTPNSSSASPTSPNSSSSSTFASERDCQLQESALDDPLGGSELSNGKERLKGERSGKQQVCDKCRNHDVWVLKRGHKGKCPYENCTCQYCSFTIKRRDLMKHQQRVRRAQVTTLPTTGTHDYVLQPVENSAGAKTTNLPSPDEMSTSSPDGNCGINDQEPHNTNQNASVERQVPWPNCSSDKPEDLRVSPKMSHQTSRGSPPGLQSSGDPTSLQSSTDSTLAQNPQTGSMPLQQANVDTMPFQQSSPNKASFQQASRESTPFQQNRDMAISYQQQSRDAVTFNLQSRDSASLQHSATDHTSFQQPIRDSIPFHQPSRQTSQFQQQMGDPSSFQQSNRESVPLQQHNRDSKPFQQLNGESMPFQMPNRECTPFQQPSREPTPFQQTTRNIASYQQTSRSMASFQQSNREPTPFHHQNRDSTIPFQQSNRDTVPFQKQRRNFPSLQESSKDSMVFPHPYRDTETPFQQQNRHSTPFQQASPVNPASTYTSMVAEDAIQSPLKRMKTEPSLEHDTVYDCSGIQNNLENYQPLDTNGNLTPPREFLPMSQDIASLRSYNNIPRSHLQPKFGVQPEDMLLRHWPTNTIDADNNQSHNGRNMREASVCSPLTHNPQQLNLLQNQMQMQSHIQPQPPHQHLMGEIAEVDFKPHVSAVGNWGSTNVNMSTLSAPRLPTNIAQTPCSAMHLNACEEFVSPSAVQSQGAWWHQVRMAGLERTNSC